jgi:polyhydroxybutyrate depolymerase
MLATLFLFATQVTAVQTFQVADLERRALVVTPTGKGPHPVVFAFHGHGGNMRQAQRSFGIERLWKEAVVVYPQGLPTKGMTDPEGKKNGWQKNKGDYGDRDLAFFDAMLQSLKVKGNIDSAHVFVTGHSNGGRMTYLLWAERHSTLAGVAPSGSPAIAMVDQLKPLPAFIVAGEKDQLIPFRSQKLTIDGIRKQMRIEPGKAKVDGYTTVEQGSGSLELGTYIYPGGHTLPKGAVAAIVQFFKRHSAKSG